MAFSVYLAKAGTTFTCPSCGAVVLAAVVAPLGQVFTAPAVALHRGVGHSVALVGTQLAVRCGDDKTLHQLGARLHSDGRITDASAAAHGEPVAGKVKAR